MPDALPDSAKPATTIPIATAAALLMAVLGIAGDRAYTAATAPQPSTALECRGCEGLVKRVDSIEIVGQGREVRIRTLEIGAAGIDEKLKGIDKKLDGLAGKIDDMNRRRGR